MPRSTAKRPRKSIAQATATTQAKSKELPKPYSTPPPVLRPLLETLNPKHVYITHIDSHPKLLKTQVFIVLVLMNILIAGLLLWRARVAIPYYIALLLVTLGYDNNSKIDTTQVPWGDLFDIAMGRTFMFFIDFSLAKYVLPWPMDFFMGLPSSPVKWRQSVGFQDEEIVVRRSRKWDQKLAKDWLDEESDATVFKERILPSIDKRWVNAKTSYLMVDKNWDLDFAGMVTAHNLVKRGKASLQDFQKMVIAYSEDHGWIVWPVWKLDERTEEEPLQKVLTLGEKLTAMGKQKLFLRWIELVHFEASQQGPLTLERRTDTRKKVKKLFELQGVDFEQFLKDNGGAEELPRMAVLGDGG